jgi:hypothetical protein
MKNTHLFNDLKNTITQNRFFAAGKNGLLRNSILPELRNRKYYRLFMFTYVTEKNEQPEIWFDLVENTIMLFVMISLVVAGCVRDIKILIILGCWSLILYALTWVVIGIAYDKDLK